MKNKTERNIFIAFLLNLGFSIYEFIGGSLTHSVAIVSDAIHDIGDALSIGTSYLLERRSRKAPDQRHTYGYQRYSLLGGLITTVILLVGSIVVIVSAVGRILEPVAINYNGMIILTMVGAVVNFVAAYFTREGDSLNQKAVNLHMLEDVLGWVVVLIGAVVMRLTNLAVIDPILSILVALFILKEALKNCLSILDVLLENTPREVDVKKIQQQLLEIDEVEDIHHFHVWSMDGEHNYATLHAVCRKNPQQVKDLIRQKLSGAKITHVTIETEGKASHCVEKQCLIESSHHSGHHHHH